MSERICADCYGCLSWDRITGTCAKGILSIGGTGTSHCYGYNPIPEPEPCEAETRPIVTATPGRRMVVEAVVTVDEMMIP